MRRTTVGLVAVLLMALSAQALADGFIVVPRHPPDRPQVRTIPLAVKYHRVKVTIKDQVALTEIDQVFVNPNPYQLEGTYIFPLPDGASISAFSMFIDGKEMPGELLERKKARKIYEDIVRRMKDPALLEYMGREMFKASIFPIPARGEKRVKLSYQEVCPADGGLVRYRYPLNTEKFSSRPLEHVSVVVDISGQKPIKNVTCPSHPVEVVKQGENRARVAYEARGVTPDRDLLLYYSISDAEFSMNFLTHRPTTREDGYFMLLLSPSAEPGKVIEKDVCFVLDTSGSMQGKKIEQAKAALKFCIQSLNPGDRFNLVPFSTEARVFSEGLLRVTDENIAKALEYVSEIRATGGTAIDEALGKALGLSPNSDRPYMIVFLTDGLPTIGETKVPVILGNVKNLNKGNVRLFAFGLGNDVNTRLLDKLAEQNRGTRDYVAESEDLEIKVSAFYSKIANPVLSDLNLTFPGMRVAEVYPRTMPDLFKGSQLVVLGRYGECGAKAVKLTGKVGGEEKVIGHDVTFPEKEEGNSFLPRLWAIRKIGFLLDEIRLHGESKELKDEVVRLAKLHGIVTPYTSFLVLEDQAEQTVGRRSIRPSDRGVRPGSYGVSGGGGGGSGGPVAESGAGDEFLPPPADAPDGSDEGGGEAEPVPAPAAPAPFERKLKAMEEGEVDDSGGAAAGPAGGSAPAAGDKKAAKRIREGLLRDATGKAAVAASKDAAKMKGELSGATSYLGYLDLGRESMRSVMKIVDGTTFYLVRGFWVQAVLPKKSEAKLVELTQFSEEYFKLLDEKPELGKILALGQVLFQHDGTVYLVR